MNLNISHRSAGSLSDLAYRGDLSMDGAVEQRRSSCRADDVKPDKRLN